MRTHKKWEELQWRYLDKFPPRLQKDLKEFSHVKVNTIKESVFIYGDVQTGKTVLAAQMMMAELRHIYLHAIPDQHNRTMFVSFPDMLADIKQTYNSPTSTQEVLNKYLNAHFLVLDDFVTSRPTDWVLETIYYLINYRYEKMLKTVITCNFSLPQLEELLHEQRITSRISRSYDIIHKQPYK